MTFLPNTIKLFNYYKSLGENALAQTDDESLFWTPDEKSNSINVIVKHLHGNMLSRWTDFLTTDGEKEWRNREEEFVESKQTRDHLMHLYNEGWNCLFTALASLREEDLQKIVYIRNVGQTVEDAIMRQLAHYAYHIGQIVYLARLTNNGDWKSLSITKGDSISYNDHKFGQEKRIEHFTDEKRNQ